MNRGIIFIIFVVIALFIIYQTNSKEYFSKLYTGDDRPRSVHLNPSEEKSDIIAKLDETIIVEPSLTSTVEVASNDIATQRRDHGRIRPYNESNILLSNAVAESDTFNADIFGNSYYQLWEGDKDREAITVEKRAEEIMKTGVNCLEFKNVNQCMSVCDDMEECTGFYIDKPNKCCIMVDPPYVTNRDRYSVLPNNTDVYAQKTVNAIVNDGDKVVFKYLKDDNGNGAYSVAMDRRECQKLCPKCIMGRCPKEYRCTDMTADPRYNQTCIITNEDRYDETVGNTFDNPSIPYLSKKYGLDEYAGYDMNLQEPVVTFPDRDIFHLDAGMVPTRRQLNQIYGKYDKNHTARFTYGTDYDISEREEELGIAKGIDQYDAMLDSDNPDYVAIRGGNDPTAEEAYRVHRVPQKYKPNDDTMEEIELPKHNYSRDPQKNLKSEHFRMVDTPLLRKDQLFRAYNKAT